MFTSGFRPQPKNLSCINSLISTENSFVSLALLNAKIAQPISIILYNNSANKNE